MKGRTRTVHLIHGFNEEHENQQPAIAMLKPLIKAEGYKVKVHDYGQLHLVETTANDNLARLIYPYIKDGDSLVGFSNGAAIIAHLQDMDVKTPHIVFIQPALKNTWVPNRWCKEIAVFWNPGDKATVAGKWWRRFTHILPWRWKEPHKWGEMGHTGYVGKDERYEQYRTDNDLYLPAIYGHSGWTHPLAREWRELMVKYV